MEFLPYLALGLLCVAMLAVAALRRVQFRRTTARELTRAERASMRSQRELRDSLDTLLTQLDEVARRVHAGADSRIQRLTGQLAAADERIARLERLLSAHGVARTEVAQARRPVAPAPTTLRSFAAPERATPGAADQGADRIAASCATKSSQISTTLDERRQRVFELADADTPALTIADLLQVPVGEVELMLSLRAFAAAGRV